MNLSNVSTLLLSFYTLTAYSVCPQANPQQHLKLFNEVRTIVKKTGPSQCAQKKTFFQQPQIDLTNRLRMNNISQPQIVLMSVEHGNYEDVTYPLFIEAMKQSGRKTDCFLLERSANSEELKFIQDINSGKEVNWNSKRSSFNIPLLQYLQREKIKIYPIDTDDYQNLENDDLAWLNMRDKNFSKKIKNLLLTKSCKTPFFPVGGAHLASGVKGRKNLSQLLADEKIPAFKTGLLIQGVRSADLELAPQWAWAKRAGLNVNTLHSSSGNDFLCSSLPRLGEQEVYTLGGQKIISPTFYDSRSKKFMGMVTDAEFWMIYTCQTSTCKKTNKRIESQLENNGISFY